MEENNILEGIDLSNEILNKRTNNSKFYLQPDGAVVMISDLCDDDIMLTSTNSDTEITSFESTGTTVTLQEQEVKFGKDKTTNQFYRAYFQFYNYSFLSKDVTSATLTLHINNTKYATALYYSIYPIKSRIFAGDRLPEYDESSPLVEKQYPSSATLTLNVQKIIANDYWGIVIKSSEDSSVPGTGTFYGSKNSSSSNRPQLIVKYYDSISVSNSENVGTITLNDKSFANIKNISGYKEFKHLCLSLGGIDLYHIYNDIIGRYSSVNSKKATQEYRFGVGAKCNFHMNLFNENRLNNQISDSTITLIDDNDSYMPFNKKYYYVKNGKRIFVNENEIKEKNFKYIYVDSDGIEYDITISYFDFLGREIRVDKSKAAMFEALVNNKYNLTYYVKDIKGNVVDIEYDIQTNTATYKMAQLEEYNGNVFVVDNDFITIENGVKVYHKNGFNIKVQNDSYLQKVSVIKQNDNLYLHSNYVMYDMYGNPTWASYKKQIYEKINMNGIDFSNVSIPEELYYLRQELDQLEETKENIQKQIEQYTEYLTYSDAKIKEKMLQIQQELLLYEIKDNTNKQIEENADNFIKVYESMPEDKLWHILWRQSAQAKYEEYVRRNLTIEYQNLQYYLNELNMSSIPREENHIKKTIEEYESDLDNVEKEIENTRANIIELVEQEKRKPIDCLLLNGTEIWFDFFGKMVQIKRIKQEININYDRDDYLINITNQNNEKLFDFEYENGFVTKITDATGKYVTLEYDSSDRIQQITHDNGEYVKYGYYDFGLHNVYDNCGRNLALATGSVVTSCSFNSKISEINDEGIVTDTQEILYYYETIATANKHWRIIRDDNDIYIHTYDNYCNLVGVFESNNTITSEKIQVGKEPSYRFYGTDKKYDVYLNYKANLLQNGSFEDGLSNWILSNSNNQITKDAYVDGSNAINLSLGYMYQNVPIENVKDYNYLVFGGYALAKSAPVRMNQRQIDESLNNQISSGTKFELRAQLEYNDGSTEVFNTTFDWKITDWQFAAVLIKINKQKTLYRFCVYVDFSSNTGTAIFDNFALCEANGSYQEINSDETINYKTNFESETYYNKYDGYNPTESVFVDKNGYKLTTYYTYDFYNRLLRTETSEGIITAYKYEENETIQETYHKDDPTNKLIHHEIVDENGRLLEEFDSKENQSTKYNYVSPISSLIDLIENGVQKIYYGYDNRTDEMVSQSQTIHQQDATLRYHYTDGLVTRIDNDFDVTVKYAYDNKKRLKKAIVNELILEDIETNENVTFTIDGKQFTGDEVNTFYDLFYVSKKYNDKNQILSVSEGKKNFTPVETVLTYSYDEKDRLVAINDKVNEENSYSFTYNNNDLLSGFATDKVTGSIFYNTRNQISKEVYSFDNSDSFSYSYEYDEANPYQCNYIYTHLDKSAKTIFNYDLLSRVKSKAINILDMNRTIYEEYYSYCKDNNQTNMQIAKINYVVYNAMDDCFEYKYDSNHRIVGIMKNGLVINEYEYDILNRLSVEKDYNNQTKIRYQYDIVGNILNKFYYDLKTNELVKTDTYTYTKGTFGLKLSKFNGTNVKTFTLNDKKQLTEYDGTTFTYNTRGLRINKNNAKYYYDHNNRLFKEENGTNTIYYFYINNQVQYLKVNDTQYILRRNIFNDVTHIYNFEGKLVAYYEYDSWGNHKVYDETGKVNENADFIGNINPIRYRGYYYDVETKLYYCNARYYNPEHGRWISEDSIDYLNLATINGLNFYSYCNNNPIMYVDPSGHIIGLIIGLLAGAFIVGSATSAISQGVTYGWDNIDILQVFTDGLFALGSTALAMTGIGSIGSAIIGAGMGFAQYAIGASRHGEDITLLGSLTSIGLGAIGGAISGAGARNNTSIIKNMKLTGSGASAVKAITTATNRYFAGEISMRGLQATTNLWGNAALNAVQNAIAPAIARGMIWGTGKVLLCTIGSTILNNIF